MDLAPFIEFRQKVQDNVGRVIVGKSGAIDLVLIAFICGGHLLVEDVPGVGKTMLIKAFAATIGADCKRIQFTPDLLPSDLTGINFYNQKTGEFEFRPGPLFTRIVLADEINRATPRTQSSLLEAMEERQVTVDGVTRRLAEPFMVLATQNPIELHGTFPLPEAQLDRFFMRIRLGYPTRQEELAILERFREGDPLAELTRRVGAEEIDYVRRSYRQVRAAEDVLSYLLDLIDATRRSDRLQLGASPRGALALFKAAQACAAIHGREYVIPEDVKSLAPHVLNHRVLTKGLSRTTSPYDLMQGILEEVRVPTEDVL